MEGSIADSTVLRMRTQLQRTHHSATTNQSDGFLEELLKIPTAASTEPTEDTAPELAALDSPPTPAAVQPDNKAKRDDDEPKDGDDSSDAVVTNPCLPVCYAPTGMSATSPAQPIADVSSDTSAAPEVQATAAQPVAVNEPLNASIEVAPTSQAAVDVQPEVVAVDEPTAEAVQPIEADAPTVGRDQLVKPARDVRRPGDNRKDESAPVHRPQAAIDNSATQTPAQTVSPRDDQPHAADKATQVEAAQAEQPRDVTAAVSAAEGKADRKDDRDERNKWYEKSAEDNGNAQPSNLAERLQEIKDKSDKSNDVGLANVDITGAIDASSSNVDTTTLVSEPSAPGALDSLQSASDIAAAVQANSAQSSNSQRVSESPGAGSGDLSGRNRPAGNTLGINSTGSMAGPRSMVPSASSSATAPTAASQAEDGPRELTQQERVRLVQRVARSFSRLGPEGGQVSLKLHPPQLGVLNVSIKIEGQSMTARLQTETSSARDTIVENLPVLRERLKEQGIEIEKFQVEVGQHEDLSSGTGQSGNFSGGGSADAGQGDSATRTDYDLRRIGRGNASRPNILPANIMEPKLQAWSATDRSLDVRA